jgi:hypothetical protein
MERKWHFVAQDRVAFIVAKGIATSVVNVQVRLPEYLNQIEQFLTAMTPQELNLTGRQL